MSHVSKTDLLFTALAEQLKLPLLQIARLSESNSDYSPQINLISENALRLIDGFVHSSDQTELMFEPLSTAAVLRDVAELIQPLAAASNYQIHIESGNSRPIMAHHEVLKTMLALLSSSIIESSAEENLHHLVLGSHRSSHGIVVGVFSDEIDLSQRALHLSRRLQGRAAQTVPMFGESGGAGLAIADRLSSRLHAPLRAYRHHALTGIGSLFVPSQQLSLVV